MNIAAIVMAGGKGKRMGSPTRQKVLREIGGRPMVFYTLDTLHRLGIRHAVVVVGHLKERVMAAIEHDVTFAVQDEPLGTGHAMRVALAHIPETFTTVLSLYGDDSAFLSERTLTRYIRSFQRSGFDLGCLTVLRKDPTGLGRIVRDERGGIQKIVEEKLATPEEVSIHEVNTGVYLFRREVLVRCIPKIPLNETGEYFLTDILELAIKDGRKVFAYRLENPDEWFGVNNPRELAEADRKMRAKRDI